MGGKNNINKKVIKSTVSIFSFFPKKESNKNLNSLYQLKKMYKIYICAVELLSSRNSLWSFSFSLVEQLLETDV